MKVHGSGCTLSSYIAGHLAQGFDVRQAVAGSKRRMQDAIAMSSRLGKGMAIINPMATKQKEAMRYLRIVWLRSATGTIEKLVDPSFIPPTGMDFVYSLPNPQNFQEVCGVDGKIQEVNGRPERGGDAVFGSSDWLSRTIMRINIECPEVMAGIEVKYTEGLEATLRGMGLGIVTARSDDSGSRIFFSDNGSGGPSEQLGLVPDVLFEFEGMGILPRIGIVGKDPDDVVRKIGPCLGV